MNLQRYAAAILIAHGRCDAAGRVDTGETASFSRALEYVETTVYRTQYPNLRARDFLPLNTRVPEGAESFTYRIWDWFGMARIVHNSATDIPRVDIYAAERAQLIRTIADSFGYNTQDLRAAAMQGVPLETEKATAARRAYENKVDTIAALGDTASNLPGFLNNANVPLLTALDLNGDWLNPATTPAEVLADMNLIANTVSTQTKRGYAATTLILPPAHYDFVSTTLLGNSSSDATILEVFLKNQQYVKEVDQWDPLTLADAAGTGPRAVAYAKSPEVVEMVEPMPFRMNPPQARALGFDVYCEGRFGGVIMRYPFGAIYADDI